MGPDPSTGPKNQTRKRRKLTNSAAPTVDSSSIASSAGLPEESASQTSKDDGGEEDEHLRRKQELGRSCIPDRYSGGTWVGESYADDPQVLELYPREKHTEGGEDIANFVTQAVHFLGPHDRFVLFDQTCRCDSDLKELRENKWSSVQKAVGPYIEPLLKLFFQVIDWTYPAVDKPRFYQAYYLHDPPLNRGLLASMLAISSMFWKYIPELCVQEVPLLVKLINSLWSVALLEIDHDISCSGPTLDTCQALLIYIQRRLSHDEVAEQVQARAQVGKLAAITFTLGLHRDCSDWPISSHEKLARRRLQALVFFIDRWTSAILGHPRLIEMPPPNFTSEFAKECIFVEHVKLCVILDGVLSDYPTLGKRQAKIHLQTLQAWRESISAELGDSTSPSSPGSKSGMLNLAELAVEALIRRKIPRQRRGAQDLVKRIITFTCGISHLHRNAFWLFPCQALFSIIAHFVVAYHLRTPPQAQTVKAKRLMKKWLSALRDLANVWPEGAGLANRRMDMVFYRGQSTISMDAMSDSNSDSEPEKVDELSELLLLTPSGSVLNQDSNADGEVDSDVKPDDYIEPLEYIGEAATLDISPQDDFEESLRFEDSLHDILLQYTNEELSN